MDSIAMKETELDVAMALDQLNQLDRLGMLQTIVVRPKFAPGSHILQHDLDPNMKIPKPMKVSDRKFPVHLRDFHHALTEIVPTIRKHVVGVGQWDIFTTRVLKRSENLFMAGNVVQIAVEYLDLGVWRLQGSVGASMKQPVYQCYAEVNAAQGVINSVCECKSG